MITTDGGTDGRTDRHSSNVLEFRIGSQIYISMRSTRIDKTNIPSMRRVQKFILIHEFLRITQAFIV